MLDLQNPRIPTELVEHILSDFWKSIGHSDHQWSIFANLSLVNSGIRTITLRVALRHVRVSAHSDTDIKRYINIRRQYLEISHPEALGDEDAEDAVMKTFCSRTTVTLEISKIKSFRSELSRFMRDPVLHSYGSQRSLPGDSSPSRTPNTPTKDAARRNALYGWFPRLLRIVPSAP